MATRALSAAIVVFWLVMTALLVRMQLRPEESELLEIPVSYVARLMFEHQQVSSLNVLAGGLRYGSLSIHPSREGDRRVLKFGGSTLLRAPLLPRDRLLFDGTVEMDSSFAVQRAGGMLALRELGSRVHLTTDTAKNEAICRIERPGGKIVSLTIPLTREGVGDLMAGFGLDPQMLDALGHDASMLRWSARRSFFEYHGERVESYELSLSRDQTELGSVFISQLGQVLRVNTALGVTLEPSDYSFPE